MTLWGLRDEYCRHELGRKIIGTGGRSDMRGFSLTETLFEGTLPWKRRVCIELKGIKWQPHLLNRGRVMAR